MLELYKPTVEDLRKNKMTITKEYKELVETGAF